MAQTPPNSDGWCRAGTRSIKRFSCHEINAGALAAEMLRIDIAFLSLRFLRVPNHRVVTVDCEYGRTLIVNSIALLRYRTMSSLTQLIRC